MFTKLLKHDTKAVFKYWWIGAVISVAIALFGGLCIQIADVDYTSYELIPVLAIIGTVFSAVGLALLPAFTTILVIVRYYKHFFTDEGYLTFTLPVKKTSLLDSKIATTFIFSLSAALLTILNVMLMLAVGIPEHFFDPYVWKDIFNVIGELCTELGFYTVPYAVLGILILAVAVVSETLFIFVCITLASSVAKKHKVLVAIGIYYGTTMATSFIMQILSFGGVSTVISLVTGLEAAEAKAAVLFLMTGVLGLFVLAVAGMYLLMLYLLDKRLNLE